MSCSFKKYEMKIYFALSIENIFGFARFKAHRMQTAKKLKKCLKFKMKYFC